MIVYNLIDYAPFYILVINNVINDIKMVRMVFVFVSSFIMVMGIFKFIVGISHRCYVLHMGANVGIGIGD